VIASARFRRCHLTNAGGGAWSTRTHFSECIVVLRSADLFYEERPALIRSWASRKILIRIRDTGPCCRANRNHSGRSGRAYAGASRVHRRQAAPRRQDRPKPQRRSRYPRASTVADGNPLHLKGLCRTWDVQHTPWRATRHRRQLQPTRARLESIPHVFSCFRPAVGALFHAEKKGVINHTPTIARRFRRGRRSGFFSGRRGGSARCRFSGRFGLLILRRRDRSGWFGRRRPCCCPGARLR
jgi:hypothetical protein